MHEREEHVRQMLREAFADVPCPDAFKKIDSCGPVIHSVALELRLEFWKI
jgi:hypothetical protein